MTTWVLSIDKDHPQHWRYAVQHKVWDLKTHRKIRHGDIVYFWQGKGTLLGRGFVGDGVSDSPSSGLPWDGSGSVQYKGRITFNRIDLYTGDDIKGAQIEGAFGGTRLASQAPHSDDSVDGSARSP